MRTKRIWIVVIATAVVILLGIGIVALLSQSANQGTSDLTATVGSIEGAVEAQLPPKTVFDRVKQGLKLKVQTVVKTLEDGKVRLDLSDGTIVRIAPSSLFTLLANQARALTPFTQVKLDLGKIWIVLHGGSFRVDTPAGLATVRGSMMSVEVVPGSNVVIVTCLEGNCDVENDAGVLHLVAGQTATLINKSTPPILGLLTDAQVAEWLANNPEATPAIPPLTKTVVVAKVTATAVAQATQAAAIVQAQATQTAQVALAQATQTSGTNSTPVAGAGPSGTPQPAGGAAGATQIPGGTTAGGAGAIATQTAAAIAGAATPSSTTVGGSAGNGTATSTPIGGASGAATATNTPIGSASGGATATNTPITGTAWCTNSDQHASQRHSRRSKCHEYPRERYSRSSDADRYACQRNSRGSDGDQHPA